MSFQILERSFGINYSLMIDYDHYLFIQDEIINSVSGSGLVIRVSLFLREETVLRILSFILATIVCCCDLLASTMPPLQQLEELLDPQENMHPSVLNWFQTVEARKDFFELSPLEFNELKKNLTDPITLFLTELYRREDSSLDEKDTLFAKAYSDIYSKLVSDPSKFSDHTFYPELLYQLQRVLVKRSKSVFLFRDRLLEHKIHSCAKKDLIVSLLDSNQKDELNGRNLEDFLTIAREYKSTNVMRKVLERAIEEAEKKPDQALSPLLVDSVLENQSVLERFSWLKKNEEITKRTRLEEPYQSFAEIIDLAEDRRCISARNNLVALVKQSDAKKLPFDELSHVTDRVGSCYRRYGHNKRVNFWKNISSFYKKTLGFKGEALAQRQLGLIYWGRDEFSKSKEIFHSLLNTAPENSEIAARNLYTLARIQENEGNIQDAKKTFTQFIARFPDHEEVPDALQTLAILNVIDGNYIAARHFTKQIIERESFKPYDEQDVSLLSFALFWSGSMSLKRGDVNVAFSQWRRLVNEFYSTFYGALGHYMLEAWMKKPLQFHPRSTHPLVLNDYTKELSAENKDRIKNADAYLEIGLKTRAWCEITEMEPEPPNLSNQQDFVKSLYYYSSGKWLAAIRKYSSLDRSFRHSLPSGMERLLFPKKYDDLIGDYASRLSIDPALIYAIMRQESVFNPAALSPVGASGLMQLMPATARLESRRLSRSYLTHKNGRAKPKKLGGRLQLFHPETNIILGVHHVHSLFKRYRHPVYVLTSYNANPRATKRWMKNIANDNMLSFVERIPYKETRAYVKLVMRNYFYYSRWYTDQGSLRRLHDEMSLLNELVPNVLAIAKREKKFAKNIFR